MNNSLSLPGVLCSNKKDNNRLSEEQHVGMINPRWLSGKAFSRLTRLIELDYRILARMVAQSGFPTACRRYLAGRNSNTLASTACFKLSCERAQRDLAYRLTNEQLQLAQLHQSAHRDAETHTHTQLRPQLTHIVWERNQMSIFPARYHRQAVGKPDWAPF